MMVLEIGRWNVKKENCKEHLETIKESSNFQKKNRERFHYKNSKFIQLNAENNEFESWMFIDEYPDKETYKKWLEEAPIIEIEMAEILEKWGKLIDVDSFTTEVFIIHPELLVK